MVRIVHYSGRPGGRVYISGHRFHHGMAGLLLAAAGVVLMWNDRHDVPWTSDRDAYTFKAPRGR